MTDPIAEIYRKVWMERQSSTWTERFLALGYWEDHHEELYGHPYVYEELGVCATCEAELAAWMDEEGDTEP